MADRLIEISVPGMSVLPWKEGPNRVSRPGNLWDIIKV